MELQEFIKLFAEQFDETPAAAFVPAADYKNLEEWNSLTALSVIAMIDDECQKRITGADLRACTTIEDLYNFVESR